jgi:tRNA threonylcarbamoyladenosine biosynthesis protein TsaE
MSSSNLMLLAGSKMRVKQNKVTASPEETLELGASIAEGLPHGTVICLYGDLGAGKTTLIKGLARSCGCPVEEVTSPTFLMMHLYEGERSIGHFDLYRLKEAPQVDVEEMFGIADLCCIEWPQLVENLLPLERLNIWLEHLDENRRSITWEWHGTTA